MLFVTSYLLISSLGIVLIINVGFHRYKLTFIRMFNIHTYLVSLHISMQDRRD